MKKLLRRFGGFLVPCFIFLIYLLVTGTFVHFWDLCLFGMFDFFNNNGVGGGHLYLGWIIVTVITFIIASIIMFKNKKCVFNYYLILGVLFTFPLFDIPHVACWLTCFGMMVIPLIEKREKEIVCVSTSVSLTFMILFFVSWIIKIDFCVTKDLNHFKFYITGKKFYESVVIMEKFVDLYDDPVILGNYSMIHTIINDENFSYFDVLCNGNYGYNGIEKMKRKIDKMHDQIFIVSMTDYNSEDRSSQFSKEIARYVMDNSEKIDSKYVFDVY